MAPTSFWEKGCWVVGGGWCNVDLFCHFWVPSPPGFLPPPCPLPLFVCRHLATSAAASVGVLSLFAFGAHFFCFVFACGFPFVFAASSEKIQKNLKTQIIIKKTGASGTL